MKIININNQQNIKTIVFPDGQPHVNISNITEGDEVKVVCSINSTSMLLQLVMCANAIDNVFAKKKELVISYLMGARYDRYMQTGDSIDLKVIATLINSLQFNKVYLFDVHSDTATMLIQNAVSITNKVLVEDYTRDNAVLICPDAGAAKKISKYFDWNKNLKEIVYCNKSRDLNNGSLALQVLEPEKCKDRNCVIIDDICDGGGTFLAIAEQIKPLHLTLIVTHGIFSKGFENLEKKFNEIIVSNSLYKDYNSSIVKTIKTKF